MMISDSKPNFIKKNFLKINDFPNMMIIIGHVIDEIAVLK